MDIDALVRLWNVTQRHDDYTSGARRAALVLLGLYNGPRFPFDLTELRAMDENVQRDALAVIGEDARRCQREVHEWLNALTGRVDFGERFEHLAWRFRVKGRCKREANNKLIGRAALDVDMKRAADELGFTTREQQHSLRTLNAGEFFAFGPAIAPQVQLVRVGPVLTTHLEPGARGTSIAPPPAPEKLQAILSQLADLPKDAAAEEGEIERLRREVAELRRKAADPLAGRPEHVQKVDQAVIDAARAEGRREGYDTGRELGYSAAISDLAPALEGLTEQRDRLDGLINFLQGLDLWRQRLLERSEFERDRVLLQYKDVPPVAPAAAPVARAAQRPGAEASAISGPLQRVLDALAELESLGAAEPERVQVAFLAGYTHLNSKGFANAMGAGRTAGLIDYAAGGRVFLTGEGRARARFAARPRTPGELQERVLSLLGGVHAKLLEPLIRAYPQGFPREDLARMAGYGHVNSKGFANAIGRLRSLGFVEYQAKTVRATQVLFIEGRR